ncbi:MAG: hypothetical protein OXU61_13780 [Gammaproteobacteria bacterium]|nr:hypothetical protein [Gammaproteobacteria bacterium]
MRVGVVRGEKKQRDKKFFHNRVARWQWVFLCALRSHGSRNAVPAHLDKRPGVRHPSGLQPMWWNW